MNDLTPYENDFVAHLNRYTTVSSEHESAFDEFISQATVIDDLRIETKTQQFVINNFLSVSPVSIILTGNAGDGKTYLCRKTLETILDKAFGSWQALEEYIQLPNANIRLRIIKDLSELGEESGAKELRDLAENYNTSHPQTVYLIAANEGRLRALLTRNALTPLYQEIDHQLRHKANLNHERLVVLNLNEATTSNYIEQALSWISDSNHWSLCEACPAFNLCPIRFNATRLAQQNVSDRLKLLYQIIEQLDEHITIRDMLIHLAYTTTSGLRCQEIIEKRADASWRDQIHQHVYYANVWGIPADSVFRNKVTAIQFLQRLDLGENSVFEIDDFILNGDVNPSFQADHQELFAEDLDLNWKGFKQDRDAYVRSGATSPNPETIYPIMDWLPHGRRKLFFEWQKLNFTNRLFPFLFISKYFELITRGSELELETVRSQIIIGLNRAFSGLFLNNSDYLYITSQYAHAVEQPVPIVRFQIPTAYIRLEVEAETGIYIDRSIATLTLIVPPPPRVKAIELHWPINLLMFEYLMRRAHGSTANILSNECELEIRQLKDDLLERFGIQQEATSISFFAADSNRYQLRKLQIEKK